MSTATRDELNAAMDQIRSAGLDQNAIAESRRLLAEIQRRNEELLSQRRALQAALEAQEIVRRTRSGGLLRRLQYWWR